MNCRVFSAMWICFALRFFICFEYRTTCGKQWILPLCGKKEIERKEKINENRECVTNELGHRVHKT